MLRGKQQLQIIPARLAAAAYESHTSEVMGLPAVSALA